MHLASDQISIDFYESYIYHKFFSFIKYDLMVKNVRKREEVRGGQIQSHIWQHNQETAVQHTLCHAFNVCLPE